jgi:uncharacterized protein YndB with AHSA1/START domain
MSEITINRVFAAPRALVFRAWTDPGQLTRWYGPRGVSTPRDRIDFDPRPGGTWSVVMVNDETGEEYPTGGVFHEVTEPERLVFTWGDPARQESMTLCEVEFADLGDKTEMSFRQTGLTGEHRCAGVHDGWSSALDKLTELLTGGQR